MFVSQGIDALTFVQPCASLLDDPIFKEGEILELFRRNGDETSKTDFGVRWFYGRVEDATFANSANACGYEHTVSGPWWWLANMGFRQVGPFWLIPR